MNWFDPIESSSAWRWRLGELDLQAHKYGSVWEISHNRVEESQWARVGEGQEPFATVERVAGPVSGPLRLRPRHADRPVVGRPELPLTLLPGVSLRVYINVPAWLSLEVDGFALWEAPSVTPADTCFGSPVEGSLAYAMRTHLRTEASAFKPAPHRIRVPLLLLNQGEDPLPIHRVRVPVQALGIYAAGDGTLWSPEVRITRSDAPDSALVEVSTQAPDRPQAVLLTPPREPFSGGPRVLRAFNSFFSGSA
ncbi:MAG: hypothetical protein ACI9VR_003170 [Cognaticolwellia sp.]|jgi:hypothetical protein